MRISRTLTETDAMRVQTFILLGGLLTTLAIWTKLEDPINLPKMFVLILFSAAVLGLAFPLLINALRHSEKNQLTALGLVGLFIIGLLIATSATDVKYTAIFGEYHRNNGLLSYLAMALLMLFSVLVFSLHTSVRFIKLYAASGIILTIYGFLQGSGNDPIGWKIDYNPFITTLGNPNFTSAALGLSGIAILLLLVEAKEHKIQLPWALCLLANLYILKRSGSIQGLFGFLLGMAIIILIKLWLADKNYGRIGLITAAIAGLPIGLAVFNIGPLASKLYQGTLENRLDYWRAAVNMFRDHPIYGVGIDRFGEYYRQYAVQNQVVQGQVTDNAHSVYMQLLATGGLVTFVPYLLLILFISFIGFKALVITSGPAKLRIGGVYGIWIGTLAVNLVAIDNLGVAVWFWITGGVLVAVAIQSLSSFRENSKADDSKFKDNQKSKSITPTGRSNSKDYAAKNINPSEFPLSKIFATCLIALTLFTLIPGLGSSQAINDLKANKKGLDVNGYLSELNRQVMSNQNNVQNLVLLADIALRQGEIDLSKKIVSRILTLDSRSFYGNFFSALILEATDKPKPAIFYREKLAELDPWNTTNMLQLITNYLEVGEKAKAEEVSNKIKLNYPNSQASKDAEMLMAG